MSNKFPSKIQKILEEGEKCKEKVCLCGPTGPQGPQGPATITIGNTTTGNPGTNAIVANTGTNQNMILDFTIPAGPTGPKGDQGLIGPTGPAGTSGTTTIDSYGSKYSTAGNTISLTDSTISTIPLATSGPILGITGESENALTINKTGVYKVDYFFNGSPSVQATLTLEVLQNGNLIGRTSIEKEVAANEDEILYGSAIINLSENDKISLGLSSNVAATVSLASSTNAYLNIFKLS